MGKLVNLLHFAEKKRNKLTAKQKSHVDAMYLYSMQHDLDSMNAIDKAIEKKKLGDK